MEYGLEYCGLDEVELITRVIDQRDANWLLVPPPQRAENLQIIPSIPGLNGSSPAQNAVYQLQDNLN